jgi:hypothetical protein
LGLFAALEPPLDEGGLLDAVPELSLSRGIGFMKYDRADYTPTRLARAAGPFGGSSPF